MKRILSWFNGLSTSTQGIIKGIASALCFGLGILFIIIEPIFLCMIFFIPGVILLAMAVVDNKKVIIGFVLLPFLVLAIAVISGALDNKSEKKGCCICGKPIFAGKFCEKHFNDMYNNDD